jgi:hypothetical protein
VNTRANLRHNITMITVTSSVGTSLDKTKRGMNSQLSSGSGTKERDDRENENLGADREKNEDDKEEEHEENIVGESAFHNSTATITSSTTSQTSSSGSRKSRRASLRSNKLAPCLFRT